MVNANAAVYLHTFSLIIILVVSFTNILTVNLQLYCVRTEEQLFNKIKLNLNCLWFFLHFY